MTYNNVIRGVAAAAIVALGTGLHAGSASALTINSTFVVGGTAHASTTGTGTLQSIFTAAAGWWEAAILDTHTLNLNYQWGALTVLGSHSLTAQSGTPNRETAGTITFDNDGSTAWWRDPTPDDSSEFSTFTAYSADLGSGTAINTGRVYTAGTFGTFFDLFNTAIHEIGHALGMSSANTAFTAEARTPNPGDSDIDVNRAGFAGTVLQVRSTSAHYLTSAIPQASLGRVVSTGSRHMLSCVDILGNAQISQFTNFNCDPDNPSTISEPGTLAVLGLGLIGLGIARRKRMI